MNKRKPPRVNEVILTQQNQIKLWDEGRYERVMITGKTFEEKTLEHIVFDEVIFNDCIFTQNTFNRIEFIDCVFNRCQFINNHVENGIVIRTVFNQTKLDGTIFATSNIEHVCFNACSGRYVGFTQSSLSFVDIHDSDFNESTWFNTTLKQLVLDDVDLQNNKVHETRFKDVDLSTCTIDNMTINLPDITGAIIAEHQAKQLLKLIGVRIKY